MDFSYSSNDSIGIITLNRPHYKNALNASLMISLTDKLQTITDSVLIIQGAGGNFCSGGDLQWMLDGGQLPFAANVADVSLLSTLLQVLYNLPIPTIAAIDGVAYGAGIGLATCCDMAIATTSSIFCLPEAKIGIAPALVACYVAESIGKRAAKHLALLATPIDATKAMEIGLINNIVSSPTTALAEALAIAKKMITTDPYAKQIIKDLFNNHAVPADIVYAVNTLAKLRAEPTAQKLINNFLQKNKK